MIPPFAKVNPLSEAVAVDLTRAIQIVFHSCVVVVTVANPLREAVAVDLAVLTNFVAVFSVDNPPRAAFLVDLAMFTIFVAVTYTHLTLPTKRLV